MIGRVKFLPPMVAMMAVSLLAGCAASRVTPEMPVSQPPLVEKLPVTIGIHYPPGTRDYFYQWHPAGMTSMPVRTMDVGPPSMRHFDRIFSAMFERTVPVDSDPKMGKLLPGLDAVLITAISDFNAGCLQLRGAACGNYIDYLFTLLRRDGTEIGSWQIHGGAGPAGPGSHDVRSAIKDATARFLIAFYRDARVKDWLAARRANRDSGGRS